MRLERHLKGRPIRYSDRKKTKRDRNKVVDLFKRNETQQQKQTGRSHRRESASCLKHLGEILEKGAQVFIMDPAKTLGRENRRSML